MDIDKITTIWQQFSNSAIVFKARGIVDLYLEILIVLALASILSWFIGLMMRRSYYKRKLRFADHDWARMYSSLEKTSQADTNNLEFQLESLAHDVRTLQATNRTLMAVLEKDELSAREVSIKTIELNRQHVKSQERMHLIMQRKDEEITKLSDRLEAEIHRTAATMIGRVTPEQVTEGDLNRADTIAMSAEPPNEEIMDATVQLTINIPKFSSANAAHTAGNDPIAKSAEFNEISNLSDIDNPPHDATVALDKGALAFFRRRRKE